MTIFGMKVMIRGIFRKIASKLAKRHQRKTIEYIRKHHKDTAYSVLPNAGDISPNHINFR